MGAISYFDDRYGKLSGSSFAEPDGTEHDVELLEANGRMLLRIQLQGHDKPTDLLFTDEQAIGFRNAVDALIARIDLDKR